MAASKTNRLLRTIFAPDAGATLACEAVQEMFDMAAQFELRGVALESRLPDFAGHLASCPCCADAYHDYLWVVQEEAAGTLVEPAHYPQADLSFLPGPLDRLRRQMGQVANEGRFWLRNLEGSVWLSLAAYTQAGPALATVKGRAASGHLLRVTIEPETDLVIELVADPEAQDEASAVLLATVHRPSRFFVGYAGSEVVLEQGDERRVAVTDEAGRVRFTHVPAATLADMVIKVRPAAD